MARQLSTREWTILLLSAPVLLFVVWSEINENGGFKFHMNDDKIEKKRIHLNSGLGLVFGAGIGLVFGSAIFDNPGLGLVFGAGIGLVFGNSIARLFGHSSDQRKNEDPK